MEHFPRAVREFADTFNELQRERQTADYNPDHIFTLSGALQIIDHARQAILRFTGVSPEIRRNLAPCASCFRLLVQAPPYPGRLSSPQWKVYCDSATPFMVKSGNRSERGSQEWHLTQTIPFGFFYEPV